LIAGLFIILIFNIFKSINNRKDYFKLEDF